MHSYAGVHMSEPTPDLLGWAMANIRPRDLYEFPDQTWPGVRQVHIPWQFQPQSPVRFNTLRWPIGASRWACGHFFVSEPQLNLIRAAVVVDGTYQASTFTFDDGANYISTELWMLPAVPLTEAVVGGGWYLITLVDERYFWWAKPNSINVYEGYYWSVVYSSIASAIGITLTVDPIASAYLNAPAVLSTQYDYLPPLIDAVARCCGQRIVRSLDGTVTAMNPDTAEAIVTAALVSGPKQWAGGQFALTAG
jgi:hypothetical protein